MGVLVPTAFQTPVLRLQATIEPVREKSQKSVGSIRRLEDSRRQRSKYLSDPRPARQTGQEIWPQAQDPGAERAWQGFCALHRVVSTHAKHGRVHTPFENRV